MPMLNRLTGEEISDSALKDLSQLAKMQIELEAEIKITEMRLEQLKEKHKNLSMSLIPNKMDELGMADFTLKTGECVIVNPFYSGRMIEGMEEHAIGWLEKEKLDGVVKRLVTVPFERGDKRLPILLKLLNKEKFAFEKKETIHPMTMKALIRELTEKGKALPGDLFSVFVGKVTKIKAA